MYLSKFMLIFEQFANHIHEICSMHVAIMKKIIFNNALGATRDNCYSSGLQTSCYLSVLKTLANVFQARSQWGRGVGRPPPLGPPKKLKKGPPKNG